MKDCIFSASLLYSLLTPSAIFAERVRKHDGLNHLKFTQVPRKNYPYLSHGEAGRSYLLKEGYISNVTDSDPCGCQYGDGTFCGTDGKCHLYNCESFYQFGPVDYTGYYGPDAPELICTDIPETTVDLVGDPTQASVRFRCIDLEPKPIGMGYTKYCKASSSNSNFTCYGLAEDTNFDMFMQQAENSQLVCDSGKYDESGYPAYFYSAVMSKTEGTSSSTIIQQGFNDTQEFNETKALTGTMSSHFEAWTNSPTNSPVGHFEARTNSPTNSPVVSPTDSPTNVQSSSAGNLAMNGLLTVAAIWTYMM